MDSTQLQTHREAAALHDNWYIFLFRHASHCIERYKDRYGNTMSLGDWEALNYQVFYEQQVAFLFQTNEISSVYLAEFNGQKIGLIFSETAYCVTTILPLDDVRLSGKRPDGSIPDRNCISPLRKERLNRAKMANA